MCGVYLSCFLTGSSDMGSHGGLAACCIKGLPLDGSIDQSKPKQRFSLQRRVRFPLSDKLITPSVQSCGLAGKCLAFFKQTTQWQLKKETRLH